MFSAAVLRNKGVPVELFKLDEAGGLVTDDNGEPVKEQVFVRFTANEVAELEERYDGLEIDVTVPAVGPDGLVLKDANGATVYQTVPQRLAGIEGFQHAAQTKQTRTARDTIALLLGRSAQDVGKAMIPGLTPVYSAAIVTAWSIANGVDAENAGKALERTQEMHSKAMADANAAMAKEMEPEAPSSGPGETGLESGSAPDPSEVSGETLMSSGI